MDEIIVPPTPVHDRHEHLARAVLRQQLIIEQIGHAPPARLRPGVERGFDRLFVIGFGIEAEGALRHADRVRAPFLDPRTDRHDEVRDRAVLLGHQLRLEGGIAHDRHPLGMGQMHDRHIARARHERVDSALQAVNAADGARGDLRADRHACGIERVHLGGDIFVEALGPGVVLFIGEGQWPSTPPREFGDGGKVACVLAVEVIEDLDHALAYPAHRLAQRIELAGGDLPGIGGIAVRVAVADRIGGSEAERAVIQSLTQQRLHLGDIVRRGRLAPHRALAHHIEPERIVRHLHADIHRAGDAVDGVDILAHCLPFPGDALMKRGAGDVLHPLHQRDQCLAVAAARGGEADSAIPHDRGGDAVVGRGQHGIVPRNLPVIMGVNVDEAGRDERAVGSDFTRGGGGDLADFGNHAAADPDVGAESRAPRAINHFPASDDDIQHCHLSLGLLVKDCMTVRKG